MCSVRRAHVLLFKGKAEVVEELDRPLRSATDTFRWPHVIRLVHYVRVPRLVQRKISRRALFARDGWRCVYCGTSNGRLTLDHVIPRSKGGDSTWENVVTSCAPVQPPQGEPAAARGAHGAARPAAAARARALHPARDAEDPAALGAIPRALRDPHARRRLAGLHRAPGGAPLRPRARVEPSVAPGEVQPVEDDAGRDARAAVGDELAVRELRQRLVPRRVQRAGDVAADRVERVRLAAPAARRARIDDDQLAEAALELVGADRVALALARDELRRLGRLLARRERPAPRRRGRARRTRRGRGGAGATRAARRRRASRRRRRTSRRRSRRATSPPRTRRSTGSGWRPFRPGGAERSRSRSTNTAPGMCPSR